MEHIYQFRNIARVVIETITPLSVGGGEKNLLTDHVVVRDVNELPYIPGAAIAGILRHAIGEKNEKSFFGFGGDNGQGSEIIFSSAQMVDEDGRAIEGLWNTKSDYLKLFNELPIRQHVRINEKGTTKERGKFDEEVVYKGTRFCFEVELLSKSSEDDNFQKVLDELAKNTLRIGGGTRKGLGEINIVECKSLHYDLCKNNDLQDYINKTSSLNDPVWDDNGNNEYHQKPAICNTCIKNSDHYTTYELRLQPDDFFLFGSGFGDDEADITPVFENYVDWSSGKPWFKENAILIPGSSVKGALSHRVAFHYNKIKKYFFGNSLAKTGGDNQAVSTLFGYASQDEKVQKRGNMLISDVIVERQREKTKIQNHVSIDRFTGGAIDGALFSESLVYGKGESYILTFIVLNDAIADNEIREAFEAALLDITQGQLPLGGGVNRGHGCFTGKVLKNGKEITK